MNSTQQGRWVSASNAHRRREAWQRWAPLVGGGALAVLGLTRRSKSGLALAAAGSAIAYGGFRAAGNGSRHAHRTPELESTMLVNASPQEAYTLWRDLEHAPLYLRHVESVTAIGGRRYKWVAVAPAGLKLQWTAEITDEREGEYIAWRSLPGSDLDVTGRVEFKEAPGGRGTVVSARMHYSLANRALARAAAGFVGRQASFFVRQDMRRFKALLEAGEIPTTEGQTHGKRSGMAAAVRAVNPDRPLRGNWRVAQLLGSLRRVS